MDAHVPVLLEEVLDGLNIQPNGTYLDLTMGRAGHSSAILKRLTSGQLIAFDQDIASIEESRQRLSQISDRFTIIHQNFIHVDTALEAIGVTKVDGILMDLGVSSPQFDTGERGFSYRFDFPLDMRMDQIHNPLTAQVILNTYDLKTLTNIFRDYGDEKYAYEIAKKIIKERSVKPIETTFELVEIIKSAIPKKELSKKGHPAKQVFQALRIAVNDELNILETTLEKASKLLKPNGRLAVITFHSGEDRIVKHFFRSITVIEGSRHAPYRLPQDEEEPEYRLVHRGIMTATDTELETNPRSSSAKLRIIERK